MATLTKGITFASGDVVTPAKLNDLVDAATVSNIVNTDISVSAGIALTKLATGALPTGITVASANIVDGTIVNNDINENAAISGSKLADNAISNTKLRDSVALSVIGNANNATNDPADIIAGTDGDVLRRNGNTLGFGKISALAFPSKFPIQIVQTVKTNVQTINTDDTWVDISGLSLTLTRAIASASGAVRVQAVIHNSSSYGYIGLSFRILRNSTEIGIGDAAGSRLRATAHSSYAGTGYHGQESTCIDFIDNAPGSTATITYKIQARIWSSYEGYINRADTDSQDGVYNARTISTLTLTELAP